MPDSNVLFQQPAPGSRQAQFCGDVIEFQLRPDKSAAGQAWLRTNLGRDALRRREILRETRRRRKRQARDWRDIPMLPDGAGGWRLALPLLEAGHFEAKAYFLPAGRAEPLWPPGANVSLNVHPAQAVGSNLIYNAFVRQFGRPLDPDAIVPRPEQARLAQAGYAILQPSGTFRDLIRELDFIIGRLGSRILMLLPIHPAPTVYGRMGMYGSPYAALDFFEVDPALAEFDHRRTPMEQFLELVDAVHARHARLWLDIAVNHTGWASKIHTLHPEWLARRADGSIRSPGAWGTVWEDLTELDHRRRELWDYLAEVFLYWCRRGVDGFRCDAAYMVPVPAWEYMVARVRREFPETFFLLEGLGGRIETTVKLMHDANLNGAYSELFQNYDRVAVEPYLELAARLARENGLIVHFAETHDNLRLAARSAAYARMRTALAALCSVNGAFAFANGVEWLATERIDVHGRAPLNWGAPENQVDWIARLQALLRTHPAFFPGAAPRLIHQDNANGIALLRRPPEADRALLALVNLDDRQPQTLVWPAADFPLQARPAVDLLTGRPVDRAVADGAVLRLELAPAETLCLARDPNELERLTVAEHAPAAIPDRVAHQRLRAKALEIFQVFRGFGDMHDRDPDRMAGELARDPAGFCRALAPGQADCLVRWQPPCDCRREVMIPAGHGVLIVMEHPFRVRLTDGPRVRFQADALPLAAGGFFALAPPRVCACARPGRMQADVYAPDGVRHEDGPVLFLPDGARVMVPARLRRGPEERRIFLATNGRGGMARAAIDWGQVYSRYDALLAANLHPRHPVDRWVMFRRCRAWLEHHGYSRELSADSLRDFQQAGAAGCWQFRVSFGDTGHVEVVLSLAMRPNENAVELVFQRRPAPLVKNPLPDSLPVSLVLRPDLEDRNFHEDTRAYAGPEKTWPAAVQLAADGFVFAPHPERRLHVRAAPGAFHAEVEWQYMVHHPVEEERGLRAHTDLFSPGYFRAPLAADVPVRLAAWMPDPAEDQAVAAYPEEHAALAPAVPAAGGSGSASRPLADVLRQALRAFIVRRDDLQTVIAGYPWFLDWGRDTLICARGMIAAGMLDEVRRILLQFAAFEQDGALPNMINGADAANRDTSDAPLWFIVACADWCRASGGQALLAERAGKRTVREVILSILNSYRRGTANGIRVDPASGLVFSPAHFTWMDTNFPAATPRAGYPVEIQALWWAALNFMAGTAHSGDWLKLARQVRESLMALFWDPARGFFCDCRHAAPGAPAADAAPDDALRPNQLLALTMGLADDPAAASAVLDACMELLVPGAIRSLADRPVRHPQPVHLDGRPLNDPIHPYWPHYEGDEDTRRKPAYHNGTAWGWLFPSFCEAWFRRYGAAGRSAAWSWLAGGVGCLIQRGCFGHLPEIVDGDYPHALRGCDAQAWSAAEAFRVLHLLESDG